MNRESAEILALNALAYIASDEGALRTLLTQTGITADEMRAAAGSGAFLTGVLEFLIQHEDVLVAFCKSEGIDPTTPAKAARAMSQSPGNRFDD